MGLWIVADGVGGHTSGEVASKIACETISDQVRKGEDLLPAIHSAHDKVLREISARSAGDTLPDEGGEENNMGTTVVALRLRQNRFQLAWAGDSRAYKWHGRLTQLTQDHSFVGELMAKGVLTKEQAARHPERHVITQSVGVSAEMALEAESLDGKLGKYEQLLLCSDGLTDELSESVIALEMHRHKSPKAQADALLEAALQAGGRDNITIIVIGPESNSSHDPDVTQEIGTSTKDKIRRKTRQWAKQRYWRGILWLVLGLVSGVGLLVLVTGVG